MRRVKGLWPTVTRYDNLERACARASLGKRRQANIARFLVEREPRLLSLQRELIEGSYRPGPMTQFEIRDPKLRTISVAPFCDRVVHHAVIDVLEPHLDRRLIHASFACRKDKGTHAALDSAQALVRRHSWFLKMDVERFFASIRHDIVMATLARIFADRPLLGLIEAIVDAGGAQPGRGLPVGNLTSQWFANLVLRPLDLAVVEHWRPSGLIGGYVRYMDDFVLFADSRESLARAHTRVEACLASLDLRAKPAATQFGRTGEGLPFLGFVLFPAIRRIRPQNRKRVVRRWKQRLGRWRRGEIDETALADGIRSMLAHLEHGTTRAWRRRWCTALDRRGPT